MLLETFSFNSWFFLALALAAVIGLRAGGGWARKAILSGFNLLFLLCVARSLAEVAVIFAVLAIIYALSLAKVKWEKYWPVWLTVLLAALIWIAVLAKNSLVMFQPYVSFDLACFNAVGLSYIFFRGFMFFMDAEVLERKSFLTFANYALFFPALISGPIDKYERFQHFFDEDALENSIVVIGRPLSHLQRMATGYVKKYVLADNLVKISEFLSDSSNGYALLWLGFLSLFLIIYLDFSGYCDIVIGLSALMGFKLVENFDRPFLATNMQDFWLRNHISLSSLIRDYVFSPLYRTALYRLPPSGWFACSCVLSFLTMPLILLWHGLSWGFALAGIFMGFCLVWQQMYQKFIYPRFGSGVKRFLDESPAFTWCCRGLNYLIFSLTILIWQQGPGGARQVLAVMFGAG